jgi:acyl transferase domain-containing protein
MGQEALKTFPIFAHTIQSLDSIIKRLEPRSPFLLEDLLLHPSERVHDAEVSQPLCTAIQIALVDLLAQWDINPAASVGHSSGEIAAAYAAGLVSAPAAMIAAVCRGRAVASYSSQGSMLAVGLGVDEVCSYLPAEPADACIACENSPGSVTLSGRVDSIASLREAFAANGVFCRELPTGRAYHSPHMTAVGDVYDTMLASALAVLEEPDCLWRRPRTAMVSSVTGLPIDGNDLDAGYWSANLRQRVRFSPAVQCMAADKTLGVMVEIGPHSALAGPFKQICKAAKLDRFTYIASLVRNKDDAEKLLSVAGSLFLAGCPVDLLEVNAGRPDGLRRPRTEKLLVDLPPYQWNYEKRYWAEPRGSIEQRARVYPRHDLLGSRISGLSNGCFIWQNRLRMRDLPWLKDHTVTI